jgi:hypothetical protein
MSLLPLISKLASSGAVNDTTRRPSTHPLRFNLGGQSALIDNEWKVLDSPNAGHCDREPGTKIGSGRLLFNLDFDPTESVDLANNSAYADLFSNLSSALDAFKQSIIYSAVHESQCRAATLTAAPDQLRARDSKIQPGCKSPLAPTHHLPTPPAPSPAAGPPFKLRAAGTCMAAARNEERATVAMGPCDAGTGERQWWQLSAENSLVLNGTNLCAKPNWTAKHVLCLSGVPIWLGTGAVSPHS